MQKLPQLFNIQRFDLDGTPHDFMLGCSTDFVTAINHCARYNDTQPETNRKRIANGYPPMAFVYLVVPVDWKVSDWMPLELLAVA